MSAVLTIAVVGTPVFGAILVDGIQDKQTVVGQASFHINAESGYEYEANLNGKEVSTGVLVEVQRAGYFELKVARRELSTNVEEESSIRFVVLDRERGDSEWGLAPWTPASFPDASASEFDGASIRVITPGKIPTGMPVPLIALVETTNGEPVRVNGVLRSPHLPEPGIKIKRGVGSGFIPAQSVGGELAFNGSILTNTVTRDIQVEDDVAWSDVYGSLDGEAVWPESARIHITADFTINTNATLRIEKGAIIKVAAGVDIFLHGSLVVNGTPNLPVLFAPAAMDENWGGIVMWQSPAKANVSNAIFTGSGEDSAWFLSHSVSRSHRPEQALFYLGPGTESTLTNCFIVSNAGQAFNGNYASLTLDHCLVQRCQTAGQINGGALRVYKSALVDFPSDDSTYVNGDNDAFYLTSGNHEIHDTLIGWCKDDGIDAGASDAGHVLLANCWIESCFHEGMALSGVGKVVRIDGSVIMNCGQAIEAGYGAPMVTVEDSLLLHNGVGARFGDNYVSGHDGLLQVSNSFLLNNQRDIWGMHRGSWTEALDRMELQNNLITKPDPNHPQNLTWNAFLDGALLKQFRATAGSACGIAFLSRTSAVLPSPNPAEIQIGLSTFSTQPVSVSYRILKFPRLESEPALVGEGRLNFAPGEVIKVLQVPLPITDAEVAEIFELELLAPSGGDVHPNGSRHRMVALAPGRDSDGDQLPDSWEMQIVDHAATDHYSAIDQVLPDDDFDGDDASNGWEFLAGTDPAFAGDHLRLSASTDPTAGIHLEFEAKPNRVYRLEFQDGGSEEGWQMLSNFEAHSIKRIESATDNLNAGSGIRFYRVVVER